MVYNSLDRAHVVLPPDTGQVHEHPESTQQQDVQDEKWFTLWVKCPGKIPMVSAASGDYVDVHCPSCQQRSHAAYLNLCYSLEAMVMSMVHVTTGHQVAVYDLCCCCWARKLVLTTDS